jgi:hypothetical protein
MKKICALFLILLLTACSSAPKTTVGASSVGSEGSTGLKTEPTGQAASGKCEIKYSNDPGWKVIFCDKLDDSSKGWDLKPFDTKVLIGESAIVNGVYTETITGKAAGNFLHAGIHIIPLGKATNFYVGITGKINSKFKNSNWGIGMLADDDRNSYLEFGFFKDSYSLYRHNKDAYLVDQVLEAKVNGLIKINQMNTMELIRDGDYIEYYANGKSMGRFNLTLNEIQYPGTNIYLFLMVDEGAKAIFDIDNILVESK